MRVAALENDLRRIAHVRLVDAAPIERALAEVRDAVARLSAGRARALYARTLGGSPARRRSGGGVVSGTPGSSILRAEVERAPPPLPY